MTITRDDILRMAREAGARVECWMTNPPKPALINLTPEQLEHFAASVAAAEREACAVACDSTYYQFVGPAFGEVRHGIAACAAAIRARSQP